MKKIYYKDLSFWLKLSVIGGFLSVVVFAIDFTRGFIIGFNAAL